MSGERPSYDAAEIEADRQAVWAERGGFETPEPADGRAAVYVKPSSPFTSGNLHMGHVRDYAIGDAYARFRRARGDAVLFGFGFDAFGLPAEMAAIERGVRPADWVERCGERMLVQMKRLGLSFDYGRAFYSSDEDQYRWSQWLFVTLLEAGLIYRDDATVDWCDTCQTTLAALQVEDGRCWRCHDRVRLIRRPTWFLRVSPYLEENDRNLDGLADWDELSLKTQRYILGRTDGVEVDLQGPDGRSLTVFSPHSGSLDAARFVLLSPRHPEVEAWAAGAKVAEQLDELRSGGWERSARDAAAVPVIDTGASVTGPAGARASGLRLAARRRPLRADRGAGDTRGRRGRRGDRRADAERGGRAARRRPRRGPRVPRGEPLPRLRLLDLPPALLGHADPRRALRGVRGRAGPGGGAAGAPAARRRADRRGQPAGRASGLPRRFLPPLRRRGAARDRHAGLPLRRALALGPGRGAARRDAPRRCSAIPT